MLLPWLSGGDPRYFPTLPNDDLVEYDMTVSEANIPGLSGVYVIPPIIMSEELD
jgi:hypothetical protein